MISMNKINNASYHLEHSQHDYYSESDNEKGIFKGSLMKYQNLENKEITEKQFLKQIEHGGEKNKGVDICFSPPKDWTLIYNLADEDTRLKMDVYRDIAVNAVCKAIEQNTYIRKTENGKTTYELAKATGMAVFNHHTSREVNDKYINPLGIVDAQEHTHITVFPKALGKDNKYHSHTLLEAKYEKHNGHETLRYFDQVGQYELAKGLQALGFNLYESDKHSNFKVKGITDELRENFSKRSEQIKSLAGDNASYSRKKEVSLKVRASKDSHNLNDLRKFWKDNAKSLGFDNSKLNSIKEKQTNQDKNLNELMADNKATISMKKLKTLALSSAKFSNKTNTEKLEEFKKNNKLNKLTTRNYVYSKNDFISKSMQTFKMSSQAKSFRKLTNKTQSTIKQNQKPSSKMNLLETQAKKQLSHSKTTGNASSNNKTSTIGNIKRLEQDILNLDPLDIDYLKNKGNLEEQLAQLKEELQHFEKDNLNIDTNKDSLDGGSGLNSAGASDIEQLSNENEQQLNNKLLELEDNKDLTEGQLNKKLNEYIEIHSSINQKLSNRFLELHKEGIKKMELEK